MMENEVTVLIIEDDKYISNFICMSLKQEGYHYIKTDTGREAISLCYANNPDVIILDLGLPDMDGIQVIEHIRCHSDKPIIVVCAGDTKIDNSKFKAKFHTKAKMIGFDELEPLIGHAAGGVCPFGVNDGVTVYLDESLKRFDTVYPAAGTANSAVRLTPLELEKASQMTAWVDVTKMM